MKLRYTKIYYYTTSFVLVLLMNSCGKEFLDKSPNGISDFWKTSEEVEQGMNAAYEPLLYEESYGRGQFWLDGASDDYVINQPKTEIVNLTSFISNVNDVDYCYDYWQNFYKIIRRCNDVLVHIDDVDFENEDQKNRILGEANGLLGFAYFELVQKYGGVPFFEMGAEDEENINRPRLSLEDSYKRIEEYLVKSTEYTQDLDWIYSGDEYGRFCKGAAYGLLAKVYAYENKWEESKAASDAVINSGSFSLSPKFSSVFSLEGEKCTENIFSVQCLGIRHSGTITSIVVLPSSVSNGAGWNYFAPTSDLANSFDEGDSRKEQTLVDINGGSYTFDGKTVTLSKSLVGDDWNTDYFCVKFNQPFEEKYITWESGLDIPILRYADVLLLNAEAIMMLNGGGPNARNTPVAAAAKSFNEVRVRAFNGDANEAISAPTFSDLMKERRCELAFEESRHFDLVRWGLAKEIYGKGSSVGDPRGNRTFVEGKNEVYPLPQQELDNSDGVLVQNPGY